MKQITLIALLSAFMFNAVAQSTTHKDEEYFEPHVGYLFAAGQVNISGTNTAWQNSLYPNSPKDQATQKDHDGNYLGLGFVYGKYLSNELQLGLGADADFYFNIGNKTRTVLPVYADLRYNIPAEKDFIYFYGVGGYAPKIGDDIYAGLKLGAGIGYSIKAKLSRHSYNISIGFNHQAVRRLAQYTFDSNGTGINTLSRIDYRNVAINSIPIKFGITF